MNWVRIEDGLPEEGQVIAYCFHYPLMGAIGRYCGEDDHMPSAPSYLPWSLVTHWMLLEVPNESN